MTTPTVPAGRLVAHGAQAGLSVVAYRGDGSVLLAFDLDPSLTENLAGFAVQRTAPDGTQWYLPNRLRFGGNVTADTTLPQHIWTPSHEAPFQMFRWVDFPSHPQPGTYQYTVTARYFDGAGGLKDGPSATAGIDLLVNLKPGFALGFTRGYLSSQAYAAEFHNAPIRPDPKTIDFATTAYQAQYAWLGYHARQLVFDFLNEAINDPTVTLDLFAFDLDEPDFVRGLQKLGGRLRAYLDNSSLHTGPNALEPHAHDLLVASAGAGQVRQGHFKRFSHDKIMIQKKNGTAVKVLTGSANFSLRGLYVQANSVLVFDDPAIAALYEQSFEQSFNDPAGFTRSAIAAGWHDAQAAGAGGNEPAFAAGWHDAQAAGAGGNEPAFAVAFSPHTSADISLDKVRDAIQGAKSSVLFAIMELGSGSVADAIKALGGRTDVLGYGMMQNTTGLTIYPPGASDGIVVPFAYLSKQVPQPFQAEYNGGVGQVIHHKFVVADFNGPSPVVFCGSSNLAAGGEQDNGDNLLAITDPDVCVTYGVEAIRLIDHYEFRAAMKKATNDAPLALQGPGVTPEWWRPYYDPQNVRCREREVFAAAT
jgi:hypothetical protein